MFFCRENELNELERRYKNGKFECMIVYGRRRVGKTALINEFCKNKPIIYFPALKDTIQGNLEVLSGAIQSYKEPNSEALLTYSSFQAAFNEIGRLAENERIVFVIDEYPYLARADASISSRLQHLIDLSWKNGKMFLILCGSSVSFMEDEVLAYESPLYGRRTGQIHLKPLDYKDCAEFNNGSDVVTKALIYGITGGIPLYIEKLNVNQSIETALVENFFNTSSYLFEEPENLLKQELREPAVYNAIIKAVASGATKLSEVATKAGLETATCNAYIYTLVSLGIIKKETPFGNKEGKKSLLKISDNFFRFWYRFVPRNMGVIAMGRIKNSYKSAIDDNLHDYMGAIFEDMCAQYIMRYDKNLPININSIGRWWGTDVKRKKAIEIDLVGEAADDGSKREFIVASCKFRNGKAGINDLEELKEYSEVFAYGAKFYYYIFSAFGFKDDLNELAKSENIRLISLEDMYK